MRTSKGPTFAEVPGALAARFGILRATAAVLADSEGRYGSGVVLALEARVRTEGRWMDPKLPFSGALTLSLRLWHDPSAPSMEAQYSTATRRLTALEQLSLTRAEQKRFRELRPPKMGERLHYEVRSFTCAKVRLSLAALLSAESVLDPRRRFRRDRSMRDGAVSEKPKDTHRFGRELMLRTASTRRDLSASAGGEDSRDATLDDVFFVPLMDLSQACRAGHATKASPRRALAKNVSARHERAGGERDAFRPLSSRDVVKFTSSEACRQLSTDSHFGWHVASKLFGLGGGLVEYEKRYCGEYFSRANLTWRRQKFLSWVRRHVFHTTQRSLHVYAETALDVPKLLAPVAALPSGYRAEGYFRKRTHLRAVGMGAWRYCFAALHGDTLFYGRHAPCLNSHGVLVQDKDVVGAGGTSATGPVKKIALLEDRFDVELDESTRASDDVFAEAHRDPLAVPQVSRLGAHRHSGTKSGTVKLTPVDAPGRHRGWTIHLQSAMSPLETRRFFLALLAARPRNARHRPPGATDWYDPRDLDARTLQRRLDPHPLAIQRPQGVDARHLPQ